MIDHFHVFAEAVNKQFIRMASDKLYTVDAGDLFETYLAAFPAGSNPLLRERTEHDCQSCKNFIRNIGHVVTLNSGGTVETVWDITEQLPYPYNVVSRILSDVVRQLPVNGIYRTTERKYGARTTVSATPSPVTYHHFWCDVPERNRPARPDKERGDAHTAALVFRRALNELTVSACQTVLDLIDSGSLYRGDSKKQNVHAFLVMKQSYDFAPDKGTFVWANIDSPVTHFRTDVIGTLVDDLSKGVALEDAVRMYESKVAPQNYQRTAALITPRMIDVAVKQLATLGLESAIERRMARISDVSVNDILFVDNAVRGQMRDGIAGLLMPEAKQTIPDVKNATPISIHDFVTSVVPTAPGISLLVQNRHIGNFVTLTRTRPRRRCSGAAVQME